MYKLSSRSLQRLDGLHPDLVKVVKRAIQITDIDFTVLEGMRTVERQKELVKKGASKTMNSRHLTGHAVDLAPLHDGKVSWDWPLYYRLEKVVKKAAKDVGVQIEWGGDWKSFKDGPHWQLPWKKYPNNTPYNRFVDEDPEYTSETDTQARTKALATAGGGTLASASIASDVLPEVVNTVVYQQNELSSGSWTRMGIALAIIVGTFYIAWRKLK